MSWHLFSKKEENSKFKGIRKCPAALAQLKEHSSFKQNVERSKTTNMWHLEKEKQNKMKIIKNFRV